MLAPEHVEEELVVPEYPDPVAAALAPELPEPPVAPEAAVPPAAAAPERRRGRGALPSVTQFLGPLASHLGLADYLTQEIALHAVERVRQSLLTDPLIQERWVTCTAPFLCNIRGEDYYFDFHAKQCHRFNVFRRARQFTVSRLLGAFNIKVSGKPRAGIPALHVLCGASTPPSAFLTKWETALGHSIFGPGLLSAMEGSPS